MRNTRYCLAYQPIDPRFGAINEFCFSNSCFFFANRPRPEACRQGWDVGAFDCRNDPLSDICLGFRSGLPGVQVDALVFQAPPVPFDKDVVKDAPLSIHRDTP